MQAWFTRRQSNRAMTLLELIMALFLFILVVPLFGGIWRIHKQAVKQNRTALGAAHICKLVLHEAVSVGYDGVDAMATRPLADRTLSLQETVINNRHPSGPTSSLTETDYVWTLEITTPGGAGEKMVTVNLNWLQNGQNKSMEMSTLLVENT